MTFVRRLASPCDRRTVELFILVASTSQDETVALEQLDKRGRVCVHAPFRQIPVHVKESPCIWLETSGSARLLRVCANVPRWTRHPTVEKGSRASPTSIFPLLVKRQPETGRAVLLVQLRYETDAIIPRYAVNRNIGLARVDKARRIGMKNMLPELLRHLIASHPESILNMYLALRRLHHELARRAPVQGNRDSTCQRDLPSLAWTKRTRI